MLRIKADLDAIVMEETSVNGQPAVLLTVPVDPSVTFDEIAENGLAGNGAWLGFDYRTFFSHRRPHTLGQVARVDQREVDLAKRRIADYARSLNDAIEDENRTFPDKVRLIVNSKQNTTIRK